MKFLADENFPRHALAALRLAKFDVMSVGELFAGAGDEEVLSIAGRESRTLLTFDKDFGELAFRRGLPAQCGVLLFRIVPQDPVHAAAISVSVLQGEKDWAGHFSVISNNKIRMTRLLKREP